MSGFQIPGLGQAKPNEVLPPLPVESQSTQPSAKESSAMTIDTPSVHNPGVSIAAGAAASSTQTENAQPQPLESSDAMAIDRPESPPSLTGALEAALGGLDEPKRADGEEPAETREQQIAAEAQAQELINAQAQAEPEATPQEGHPEWEEDSSPYESSSESSSDSSDADSDDDEPYELLGVEETARLLMEAEGGSDDEGERGGKASGNSHVRTKNEMDDEPVPKPDVTITDDMKIEELGSIQNIVEGTALIKAITPGEYQVLDTGSVLCKADRTVIGAVAETIGKVIQPLYTVRFSSPSEPADLGLEPGTKIFYSVDHANYVFTEPLKNLKGSDASNIHDEEVGDDEMEFSDDEKEAEYKRSLKQKKRERARGGASVKGKEPHPLRQEVQADGGLNYDEEDDDGPYKPLARPPGFGSGPVSTETYDPRPRGGFRGGRGDGRGRAGRGRGGRGGRGGSGAPRDGYSLPAGGSQQYLQGSGAQGQWGAAAQTAPAPPTAGFGFQMPAWPQPPAAGGGVVPPPPPPPPGWPGQGQAVQGQPNPAFNPAVFAALLSQMQQAQQNGGGQPGGWPGQQPPPSGQ